MKTDLITKIVMYVIFAVSIVLGVMSAMDENPSDAGSGTDMSIYWACGVFVFGIVCAIFAEVMGIVSDPSSLVKTAIALVGVAALVAICWGCADGTPLNMIGYEGNENQSPWLEIADTSIFVSYIAMGGALLSIAVSEIMQLFR